MSQDRADDATADEDGGGRNKGYGLVVMGNRIFGRLWNRGDFRLRA